MLIIISVEFKLQLLTALFLLHMISFNELCITTTYSGWVIHPPLRGVPMPAVSRPELFVWPLGIFLCQLTPFHITFSSLAFFLCYFVFPSFFVFPILECWSQRFSCADGTCALLCVKYIMTATLLNYRAHFIYTFSELKHKLFNCLSPFFCRLLNFIMLLPYLI